MYFKLLQLLWSGILSWYTYHEVVFHHDGLNYHEVVFYHGRFSWSKILSWYTYDIVIDHVTLTMKWYFIMMHLLWRGILPWYTYHEVVFYHEVEIGHVTLTIKFYSVIDNVTCHLPGSGNLSCCA